jgi:hypothetical protein
MGTEANRSYIQMQIIFYDICWTVPSAYTRAKLFITTDCDAIQITL